MYLLIVAAVVSLALNLFGTYTHRATLVYVFKPLTTAIVIAIALLQSDAPHRYRVAILIGLLLSLAGDVFLMLPRDRFVAGLVSFLLAHLAYLAAFTAGVRLAARPMFFIAYALVGAVLLSFLWSRLGNLRIPVLLYVAVILAMAAQAAVRASLLGTTAALLAAVGAALFVISDSLLAFDRFRGRFASAQALIMTTYIAAQLLIAMSLH